MADAALPYGTDGYRSDCRRARFDEAPHTHTHTHTHTHAPQTQEPDDPSARCHPRRNGAVSQERRVSFGRVLGASRSCLPEKKLPQRREGREGGGEGGSTGVANPVRAAVGREEHVEGDVSMFVDQAGLYPEPSEKCRFQQDSH